MREGGGEEEAVRRSKHRKVGVRNNK